MGRSPHSDRPNPSIDALEAQATRAGAAMACIYSTSAEFDAALIAARRATGVYGPRRYRRQILVSLAAVAAGLMFIVFLVI